MKGHVYILLNSSLPNLIKVGRTTKTAKQRAQELSGTGTPGRFIVAYSVCVDNCIEVEAEMHSFFSKHRHTNDREFFELDCNVAIDKLIEISRSRLVSANDVEDVPSQLCVASLYLVRLSKSRNLFRIGMVPKTLEYLFTDEFSNDMIELYRALDGNFFYECEVINRKQFTELDNLALSEMRDSLVAYISNLSKKNSAVLHLTKYDANTFSINFENPLILKQIFDAVISICSTVAIESKSRASLADKVASEKLRMRLIEEKLVKVGGL